MNRLLSPSGDILPASEGTLIYFASYLARTVRHSTIKLYLAAVRNLHIRSGFSDPVVNCPLLKKVLRGILRYQGSPRTLRQLVTPRVLLSIRPVLESQLSPRDFSMVWAAFTLAFFAFLGVASLHIKGFIALTPSLTSLLIVLHFLPVWPARSASRFSLRHPRPMSIGKGNRLVLLAVLHCFAPSQPCNSIFC